MARTAANISDIYGPSASALFPTTAAAPVYVGGSTQTQSSASGIGGAGQVPITSALQSLQGTVAGQPLTWLFGLVLVLIAWKLIEEHRGGKEAFSKVKVDGTNLIKIGLMATIFLIIARYFFARYSVPGISDLIVGGT